VNTEKVLRVNHIAAVGIIYKRSDPRWVFIEMKTSDYPRKIFASLGLIIGGNWIGEIAKVDKSTRDTLVRELGEEISCERPIISFDEWNAIVGEGRPGGYVIKPSDWTPSEADLQELIRLKKVIASGYVPFGDYHVSIPESIFRRAEPDYYRGSYEALFSVWQVGLSDGDWQSLKRLQRLAGNLSNESITVMTSLDRILKTRWQIGWGEDRILRDFFFSKGLEKASGFPLIPGITAEYCGFPLIFYGRYLRFFDVDKRP